jgi:hypothetical protein
VRVALTQWQSRVGTVEQRATGFEGLGHQHEVLGADLGSSTHDIAL